MLQQQASKNEIVTQNTELSGLIPRSPVVVIMGHVDHGKTTLLDTIRKTNVAAREAGGITQSTGAYEILHKVQDDFATKTRKITFIDTPGHEAFSNMRSRGATVADLAILIVAADDGVKPQTKESIQTLEETKTPFVVAINKIDKPNADIEKTINDLMQNGVYLEGRGGNISWQNISAKSGQGIDELLDLVLLAAEVENLTYSPASEFAEGIILEAKRDNQRGVTASAIVKNGVLKAGDYIATKTMRGKIKLLENFKGEKIQEALPSSPVLILGFDDLPIVGEIFKAGLLDIEKIRSDQKVDCKKNCLLIPASDKKSLNIIIKADVFGSLEALSQIIKNLPQENLAINVVDEKIGDINDNDIKLAVSTNSIVVSFKTNISKSVENMASLNNVKIISSEIIYELIKAITDRIEKFYTSTVIGELEILAVFNGQKKEEQVIGGKVLNGSIKNRVQVKILRGDVLIGTGKITNLQKARQDVSEVKTNEECGIMLDSDILTQKGDVLRNEIPPTETK
ncbi:MAG: translation initiation factor IF-2 [Patescibacteria group bacterium]|mgnify:CR=1 FL=1